jgi:hypothetical protein
MSQYQNPGFIASLSSKSPFGEVFLVTVILVSILIFFFTSQAIYNGLQSFSERFQVLMDYTASSQDKALVIHQNANIYPDAKTLLMSQNEPSGTEFAYSFFIFINPSTFNTGNNELYHVWHKGYGCVWPLMGPGVFVVGNTNSLRIVMTTYEKPYNYVDITNIPVKKWVHVVLNCHKGALEIHINGNLTNKMRFDTSLPYLNYQDIILFSNAHFTQGSQTPGLSGNALTVSGAFNGLMSKFIYTRYALSFTEIQSLLHAGPSSVVKTASTDMPSYLADTWWTTNYKS